ncbi:helix-turn-helix domain-containing protein [Xanthomonas bromi]|nr:helix-turn-helix domain-containing protein [Xanthomonas bromi]
MGRSDRSIRADLTANHAEDRQTFLTSAQLVERWNGAVTAATLANWRSQGRGPSFTKLGSKVLYPLASLIEWERANTHGPN